MSCRWYLLLFLIGIPNVLANGPIFNVDTENRIIFETNLVQKSDQFGQGLSIPDGVAIIGAPKADTHGKIFTCKFDGKGRSDQNIQCNKRPGKMLE